MLTREESKKAAEVMLAYAEGKRLSTKYVEARNGILLVN